MGIITVQEGLRTERAAVAQVGDAGVSPRQTLNTGLKRPVFLCHARQRQEPIMNEKGTTRYAHTMPVLMQEQPYLWLACLACIYSFIDKTPKNANKRLLEIFEKIYSSKAKQEHQFS